MLEKAKGPRDVCHPGRRDDRAGRYRHREARVRWWEEFSRRNALIKHRLRTLFDGQRIIRQADAQYSGCGRANVRALAELLWAEG